MVDNQDKKISLKRDKVLSFLEKVNNLKLGFISKFVIVIIGIIIVYFIISPYQNCMREGGKYYTCLKRTSW